MAAKEGYMAGLGKLGADDLDGAIVNFQQALEEDASFFMAHLGLAQALDRQGKVDDAIQQVKRAVELAPDEALAHTSLSRLYQQKGMIAEAEEAMATSQKLSALG
ncbi:MAG: tetratricopeptide repeat protein [Candidatus Latescibacteria bacterium]|nr:tetratricopeptide repeat protein [Candidatus Latescibacterota bacterium]